ncbi:DUF305 domain-containing protein [Candidatus Saccharibacteria bacterium]|nr:DUF305 domain-containing protein [Candidatus Saccharibacteria bacterium]
MKKLTVGKAIIVLAGLLAVVAAGWYATTANRDQTASTDSMAGMDHGGAAQPAQDTVADNLAKLTAEYSSLQGDEFDKKYVGDMIEHHKGAVDMANMALSKAKHTELQTMAGSIIESQSKEIETMTAWQKAWGYPAVMDEFMMDHSTMGMTDMDAAFKDKTGDDFDKTFLQMMIEHHQGAVAMSRPAATNAKHDEVKQLAAEIIAAQEAEIAQMQQWLADWGYGQ